MSIRWPYDRLARGEGPVGYDRPEQSLRRGTYGRKRRWRVLVARAACATHDQIPVHRARASGTMTVKSSLSAKRKRAPMRQDGAESAGRRRRRHLGKDPCHGANRRSIVSIRTKAHVCGMASEHSDFHCLVLWPAMDKQSRRLRAKASDRC